MRSKDGNPSFFKASRFLFFRFRPDYWWYGVWFILRGPLLAIPVAVFTDLPQVQTFIMTVVLETGLRGIKIHKRKRNRE